MIKHCEQLQNFFSQNSSRSINWFVVYNDWFAVKEKYDWNKYDDGNHCKIFEEDIEVYNNVFDGNSSWI